ncbi:MAG: AAA family ATPase [Candidatus Methanofastidiosia archaeon]
MTHLILVVGMPGCGKGEFVKVAETFDFCPIVMGDIVREHAAKKGLNVRDSGKVAQSLREDMGNAAIAKLTLPKIEKYKNYIIDGIRGISEVFEFKKKFDTSIIAIHSSPRTRYNRLKKRGRKDDPPTFEDFQERDMRELGFGIGDAIALADIAIVNEGTIKEFYEDAKKVFSKVEKI